MRRFSAPFTALLLVACAGGDSAEVTWHEDVAPIVHEHCAACHTPGNIAPFSLEDYATAASLGAAIVDAVDSGRMPPWLAQETDECAPRLPFKDDMRLTEDEKQVLRHWVNAGAPEGNPRKSANLPEPPSLQLDNPSVTRTFAAPYQVEGSRDDFQCFVLDPGNTEMMWVTGAQLIPDNELVAHHGLMFVDVEGGGDDLVVEDGRFPCFTNPSLNGFLLATWTPGAAPMRTPDDAAMPVPAGARIIVQMHYHPASTPQMDQSTLQLEWSNETPEWAAAQALLGNNGRQHGDGTGLQPGPNDGDRPEFRIPAGVSGHTESLIYRQDIPFEFPIFSVGTHMHYVGTDMKIDLVRAAPVGDEPAEECLVQTPGWDFNWQRVYDYDADVDDLPHIGPGDELRMRCTYDNTLDNPFVADALAEQGLGEPQDVTLGEQTLDEMCLGLFGILLPPGLVDEIF